LSKYKRTFEWRTPKGKDIIVCDQSDNSKVYFNIPAEPDLDEVELSEDMLEKVSGGATPLLIGGFMIGFAVTRHIISELEDSSGANCCECECPSQ